MRQTIEPITQGMDVYTLLPRRITLRWLFAAETGSKYKNISKKLGTFEIIPKICDPFKKNKNKKYSIDLIFQNNLIVNN